MSGKGKAKFAAVVLPVLLLVGQVHAAFAAETSPVSGLAAKTHIHGLAVDRSDPSYLLIATHHGLYRAGPDGNSVLVSEVQDFMGFNPHPSEAGKLFASGHPAGGGNMGFIASEDGGKTWSQISPGLNGPVDFHQMTVSPADPNRVYGAYGEIQVSSDGGKSWASAGPAPEKLIDLAASAKNPDIVYAATEGGLSVSLDGGKSWKQLLGGAPVTLVEATSDGVFAFVYGKGLMRASEGRLQLDDAQRRLGRGLSPPPRRRWVGARAPLRGDRAQPGAPERRRRKDLERFRAVGACSLSNSPPKSPHDQGDEAMSANRYSRRAFMRHVAGAAGFFVGVPLPVFRAIAAESDDEALMKRFEHLSRNGNSNCSGAFMESISTMPPTARLQGSCCAPMDAHRYVEQIKALRAYKQIGEIPDDPYDIEAGLARKLIGHYDLALTAAEQPAYDFAMEKSDERGPCCCGCWRWYVYGGLAKQLIRERGFTGEQVTEVWNLSSGCGGSEHHH